MGAPQFVQKLELLSMGCPHWLQIRVAIIDYLELIKHSRRKNVDNIDNESQNGGDNNPSLGLARGFLGSNIVASVPFFVHLVGAYNAPYTQGDATENGGKNGPYQVVLGFGSHWLWLGWLRVEIELVLRLGSSQRRTAIGAEAAVIRNSLSALGTETCHKYLLFRILLCKDNKKLISSQKPLK